MKNERIEINGRFYEPVIVESGDSCGVCDLAIRFCNTECFLFEEDYESVAMKLVQDKLMLTNKEVENIRAFHKILSKDVRIFSGEMSKLSQEHLKKFESIFSTDIFTNQEDG